MYQLEDLMVIAGAREIRDHQVCFVGIGLPGRAAVLAKRLHAPNCVLMYESGVIDADPPTPPPSIGDHMLVDTAATVVSMSEAFNYWLQGGRVDLGFLGAAQIDRLGNINTTIIGRYESPTVRLPGAGGAPEIASSADEVVIIVRHGLRTLVDQVDFVTTIGHGRGDTDREALGLRGKGPTRIVTDRGVLTWSPTAREFMLSEVYPGVRPEQVQEETGWALRISDDVTTFDQPSSEELDALRKLRA